MQEVLESADRGATRTGWLESLHSFSFGDWRAPHRPGFRALRVLNEDRVAPGSGFGPHPHRDMEILTLVLSGALEHRDSSGARSLLHPGDVAWMGAGRGVVHSEWNASGAQPVHFLQIWLRPGRRGLEPAHDVRRGVFPLGEDAPEGLRLLAGPEVGEGALRLRSDARVLAGRVRGRTLHHPLEPGRGAWVQAVRGGLAVNGTPLSAGDGVAIQQESTRVLTGEPEGDFLVFDLG